MGFESELIILTFFERRENLRKIVMISDLCDNMKISGLADTKSAGKTWAKLHVMKTCSQRVDVVFQWPHV